MRIRVRLALYGAGVVAVAMVALGTLLSVLAGRGAPGEQDLRLADLVDQGVGALAAAPAHHLVPTVPPVLTDLGESTDAFLIVLTEDGTVLYTTAQLDGTAPRIPAAVVVEAVETGESVATIRPADQVELRVHARPWNRPDVGAAGIVVAGQSTRVTEQQLAGLRVVIWTTTAITLIAALVVSWLVSGRALRPLRRLAETTDEIGRTGDLSRRLAPVRARDEVGVLTTSFNQMLEGLESAQARLAAALEAQRRFVADASHELRSPLTTIRNNAGFLQERPDVTDADRGEAIGDIAAEADRMARLVDDLLTLARADAGQPLDRRPVDLAPLLQDVGRKASHLAGPVQLDVAGPALVMGDADALTRLAWILLENAAGHGDGVIAVHLAAADGWAEVKVTDQGPGIPAEDLDRVFDRFYRADPARRRHGVGLGLAIARTIVDAHEGTIAAANRPEGGATITARLPLAGS